MRYYVVQNKPVIARKEATAQSAIINAYAVNSVIPIISQDAGWYKTESGSYIFETENLIPYLKWKREHPEVQSDYDIDRGVRPRLKISIQREVKEADTGDTITLKGGTKKDADGRDIPEGELEVTSNHADEGWMTVVVKGAEKDKVYKIKYDDVESVTASTDPNPNAATSNNSNSNANTNKNSDDPMNDKTVSQYLNANTSFGPEYFQQVDLAELREVFGAPYQFLPNTDRRIKVYDGFMDLGRKYQEKIASRAPVLIVQAGTPEFLRAYNDEEKNSIKAAIANLGSKLTNPLSQEDVDEATNVPGQYYSFRPRPEQYYSAVDEMCKAMAILIGIGDYEMSVGSSGSKKLKDIHWQEVIGESLFSHYAGAVPFYVHADAQISETFGNTAKISSIANKFNQFGMLASEAQFLIAGASAYTGIEIGSTFGISQEELLKGRTSTGSSFIHSILDNVEVLVAGGRMAFPEIWQDSQFSRTYNVTLKFDSPDADNVSIFLNVLVPLAHILGFVMPRSVGVNNYISPFLVRAYFRSTFHIDMGLITSCSIQKGDVGAWNQTGLPTRITVQLQIKDLYNVLSIAGGRNTEGLLPNYYTITSNPGQLDYIANLCGVNIDTPSAFRSLALWAAINSPLAQVDRIRRYWQGAQVHAYDRMIKLYTNTLNRL